MHIKWQSDKIYKLIKTVTRYNLPPGERVVGDVDVVATNKQYETKKESLG